MRSSDKIDLFWELAYFMFIAQSKCTQKSEKKQKEANISRTVDSLGFTLRNGIL